MLAFVLSSSDMYDIPKMAVNIQIMPSAKVQRYETFFRKSDIRGAEKKEHKIVKVNFIDYTQNIKMLEI